MKYLTTFYMIIASVAALPPNFEIQDRIIQGKDAPNNQFPYMVGLYFFSDYDPCCWRCGGSLISSKWVLTAAHCTDGSDFALVKLGSIRFDMPKVSYNVHRNEYIQHKHYVQNNYHNDISLIPIPKVEFMPGIQKIDLASQQLSFVDENVIVSGWGKESDNSIHAPDILKYASMKVIDNAVCAESYNEITEKKICATSATGENTCEGDSGGPMTLSDPLVLIGITSYGRLCEDGSPGVFTRVSSYVDWIERSTGESFERQPEISTKGTTESTTEMSTERTTETTTKMSTEISTKITTEMSTERTTAGTTEASTEISTQINTETSTEASTKSNTIKFHPCIYNFSKWKS